MGLNVRLTNIVSPNDFTLSYKIGTTIGDVNSGFINYNGTYSGGTTEIIVNGPFLNYDTQYWFKITDTVTESFIIENIYIHDSCHWPCVALISPTPSITPTKTSTPSITPTITPTRTITPSNTATPTVTPSNTATPTVTPTVSWSPGTSLSPTPTVTPTNTATPSVTPSNTITPSITTSITPTPTNCSCYEYSVTNNIGSSIMIIWTRCNIVGGGPNAITLSGGETYNLCACSGTVDTANPLDISNVTITQIGSCPSGIPPSPTPTATPTPTQTNATYYSITVQGIDQSPGDDLDLTVYCYYSTNGGVSWTQLGGQKLNTSGYISFGSVNILANTSLSLSLEVGPSTDITFGQGFGNYIGYCGRNTPYTFTVTGIQTVSLGAKVVNDGFNDVYDYCGTPASPTPTPTVTQSPVPTNKQYTDAFLCSDDSAFTLITTQNLSIGTWSTAPVVSAICYYLTSNSYTLTFSSTTVGTLYSVPAGCTDTSRCAMM